MPCHNVFNVLLAITLLPQKAWALRKACNQTSLPYNCFDEQYVCGQVNPLFQPDQFNI